MADQEIASLFAKLGVKLDRKSIADAYTGLGQVEKGAEKVEKASDKAGGAMGRLAARASAAASVGLKSLAVGLAGAAAAAFALVERTASAGAAIDDMAKRTGASVRDLQRLAFAAEQSGTELGDVETGLRKLSKSIFDAGNSASPAAKAFARLGVDAAALGKLGAEDQLAMLADAFGKVESDVDRTALAMVLLGKAGTGLLPLFEDGGAGLRAMGDEAERLGTVLSDEAIANAAKLDDTLAALKAQIGGVAAQLGASLLPMVQEIAVDVMNWVAANDDLIRTKVEEFLREVIPVARSVGEAIVEIVGAMGRFIEISGSAESALKIVAGGFIAIQAAAFGIPGLAFAAGAAIGVVAAGIISDWNGVNEALAHTRRLLDALNPREKGVRDANEALDKIRGGKSTDLAKMSDRDFEAVVEKGRSGFLAQAGDRGGAISIADRQAADKQADAFEREARSRREVSGTQYARERGNSSAAELDRLARAAKPTKRSGRGGGRSGAKVKPEESAADMLERDFGGKGSSPREHAGGGASAVAGASFVRIDASFNAPTTVNVVLPKGALGRTDEERGKNLGDGVGKSLEKRNRDAAEHFKAAVRG